VNQIKDIGGFRILGGDLERVFTGGFAGGLHIGDADVTIWGGGEWSRAFGPPLVPGVPRGPFPVYQCPLVVSSTSCLVSSHYTAPSGFPLCSSGALCSFPPAPHGDGSAIRSAPPASLFSFFVTPLITCSVSQYLPQHSALSTQPLSISFISQPLSLPLSSHLPSVAYLLRLQT